MALSELDLARLEHEQAARNVRRLGEARRYQNSARLDHTFDLAIERQQRAAAELARLESLEGATRPGGAETRHTETETDLTRLEREEHAPRI